MQDRGLPETLRYPLLDQKHWRLLHLTLVVMVPTCGQFVWSLWSWAVTRSHDHASNKELFAGFDFSRRSHVSGPLFAASPESNSKSAFLWKTLKAFHLPQPFIDTVKSLYSSAYTQVAINGILSTPFCITRGVRQGNPLSCALFDLAIEPLACTFRQDNSILGLDILGLPEKLIINLFADDTTLFLSSNDHLDYAQHLLHQ